MWLAAGLGLGGGVGSGVAPALSGSVHGVERGLCLTSGGGGDTVDCGSQMEGVVISRDGRLVVGVLALVMAAGSGLVMTAGAAAAEGAREALVAVGVPAGAVTVQVVQAQGVQIYVCAALTQGGSAGGGSAWAFREPLATLLRDGATVGRHFAGPIWEMADGSWVKGRVVTQAAGERAGDIPWLRLAVVGHGGDGVLGAATGVARVATHGGVFGGACDVVGAFHLEPYSAEYIFYSGG